VDGWVGVDARTRTCTGKSKSLMWVGGLVGVDARTTPRTRSSAYTYATQHLPPLLLVVVVVLILVRRG